MYGVQWFKVDRNIFNNRKIQLILKHKDGDLYFRVWIQLLSIAVECGNDGRLEIGQKPITFQDCAKIMGKTSDKIRRILEEFLELGMLQKEGETFLIKNWDKYQSIDKYENYQENNRQNKSVVFFFTHNMNWKFSVVYILADKFYYPKININKFP